MAPELHCGTPAGVASDVYSLGCLLWATLTGRAPYVGATEDQVVAAHREQPVPQLLGDSPMAREVNRILRTAMAKDPAARYPLRQPCSATTCGAPRPSRTWPGARWPPRPLPAVRPGRAALLVAVVAGSIAHATSAGDDECAAETPAAPRPVTRPGRWPASPGRWPTGA